MRRKRRQENQPKSSPFDVKQPMWRSATPLSSASEFPYMQEKPFCPCDGDCPECTVEGVHDLRSTHLKGDPVLEACYDNQRLLHYGHRGPAVARAQQAITDYFMDLDCRDPLPVYGVDGIFGPETRGAVKEYQQSSGQTGRYIDGIIGPITTGLLDKDMLGLEMEQPPALRYTVEEGDSLDSIAEKFNTTPGVIREANDMPFGEGAPRPGQTIDVQGQPGQCRNGPPKGKKKKKTPDRNKKCPRDLDPDDVVLHNSLSGPIIEKPGDYALVAYKFACKVLGYTLTVVDQSGTEVRNFGCVNAKGTGGCKRFKSGGNAVSAVWEGKISYDSGGMYIADDDLNKKDTYYFLLKDVKYAHDASTGAPKYATGSRLISSPVEIKTREYQRTGNEFSEYVDNNRDILAKIVASEMGIGNIDEKRAIAWAVRNQMLRVGTNDINETQSEFKKDDTGPATAVSDQVAFDVLTRPMGNDEVRGAVRWFSPRSMPGPTYQKYRCKPPVANGTEDCNGGPIEVNARMRYRPRWALPSKMDRVVGLPNIDDWNVILYTLKRK